MPNGWSEVDSQQLRRAADIKEKIEALLKQLEGILGSGARKTRLPRARMAVVPRKRWAKMKRAKSSQAQKPKPMSAAARARLATIAKARWKKAKAQGRTAL
jgi:hypothetical protein